MSNDAYRPAGAKVKISKAKEEELLAQFQMDLNEGVGGIYDVQRRAARAHKHYLSHIQRDKSAPYVTDSYDAQFFGSVLGAVAAEFAALTAAPYFLKYQARSKDGDVLANFYDAAFDFHWNEDPQRWRKVYDILLQRRLYGTAYAKLSWNEEWRKESFLKDVSETIDVPIMGMDGLPDVAPVVVPQRKWVTERRKKKDSPWFDCLNFFNCIPDSKQQELQDGRFFIIRSRRTRGYVAEQGRKKAWYPGVVRDLLDAGGASTNGSHLYSEPIEALNSTVGMAQDGVLGASDDIFEVFEYHTQDGYAIICNNRVVCYRDGHLLGYYPLLHVRNYLVPGDHFGMSDFQVVESNLKDLQSMHNTAITNALNNAFPPMAVGPGVNIRDLRSSYRPGGILRLNMGDPNTSIKQLPPTTESIQMANNVADMLRGRMDNTLATSDVARGALPTRSQSATAVSQATASLSVRQGLHGAMFEADFVQPLGESFRDMIAKLQSEDISTKLRGGKEWVTLQASLFNQDPDLDCTPISSTSKLNELEQKRLMELANLVANFQVQNINLPEIVKILAESMAPRLAERISMTNPEYERMIQAQALLRQMTEPQQPGPGRDAPGAMAVSNQIGNAPQDVGMDEMSQEMGESQTA